MTTYLQGLNLSILSIPAFYLMALAPHAFALHLHSQGDLRKYDGRNPRSLDLKERLKKQLGPKRFATYERAESASANAFENFPLYAATIIIGNIAGLKQEGRDGLNGFVASFLIVRALHSLVYINNAGQGLSAVRSLLYFTSLGLVFRVFWQAAQAMGSKGLY